MKAGAGMLVLALVTPTVLAKPPVLTAPAAYVESAPAGMVTCERGMKPQLTRREFRTFALRNQVWPQEEDVDRRAEHWAAGKLLSEPRVELQRVGGIGRRFRAEVYVLIGSDGAIMDRVVTCISDPAHSESLLKLVDSFDFEPSRYKGAGLNTVMPVHFKL